MGRIIRLAIILLIADGTMINFTLLARGMSAVEEAFEEIGLVPDVIPNAPSDLVNVDYISWVDVKLGNELTPTQVKDVPFVEYNASCSDFYTLAMIDPDVPSRAEPSDREWQHWLIGNIAGNDISSGETLSAYIGAAPSEGTGLHRYVFLVYKQPEILTFDEPRLTNTSADNRVLFSITNFANKYNMGDPIAGNFYQAQYDDYVPILNEQIGA